MREPQHAQFDLKSRVHGLPQGLFRLGKEVERGEPESRSRPGGQFLTCHQLVGSYVGSLSEAEAMMELVRAGKVNPTPVKEVPLSSANTVLEDLKAGKVIGRVVLVP